MNAPVKNRGDVEGGISDVQSEQFTLSLSKLASVIWDRKFLLSAVGIVAAIASYGASYFVEPAYRSTVVMMQDSQMGGGAALVQRLGGLASLAGLDGIGGSTGREEALEYLKSRSLVDDFIQTENLLPVLFADRWDSIQKKWAVPESEIPTAGEAYRLFDGEVRRVVEDRRSGVVTLSMTWTDRQLTAHWANDFVRRANQRLRERAIAEAKVTIDYLTREAKNASVVEIQNSIYRILEDQYKSIAVANAREQYSFRIIDPAIAPDSDRVIRPRRLVFAVIGLFFAVSICSAFFWLRAEFKHRSVERA